MLRRTTSAVALACVTAVFIIISSVAISREQLLAQSSNAALPQSIVYSIAKDQRVTVPQSAIWRGGEPPVSLVLQSASPFAPKSIHIRASNAGAGIVWVYGNGVGRAVNFSYEPCGGVPVASDCIVQTLLYDFDDDGRPETVVAIGSGLAWMKFWILQYKGKSSSPNELAKYENWPVIFEEEGQQKILLSKKTVIVPFGGQGLFAEYVLSNGRFVKKN